MGRNRYTRIVAVLPRACSSAAEHGAHNPRVAGSNPAGPTENIAVTGPAKGEAPRTAPRRRRLGITSDFSIVPGPDVTATQYEPLYGPSRDLAIRITEIIADTPAANTIVIDIHAISSVADCFVICSGENERQLRAISRDVLEQMEEAGTRPGRIEGTPASGWILIDFGDVIVHIFDVDQRAFYNLEDVWSEAPTLLAMQ